MWNINPYIAIIIFLILLVILGFVFWPRKGLVARLKKMRNNTQRVFMEDALKHLFDYETHKLGVTINSIAGNLSISPDKASKIIEDLKKLNLVILKDQTLHLTEAGKSYALRIIRVHRLWENFLAQETGFHEIDWHDEAEKIEHSLSKEEADILSAKMGNPKYDPHGDPIPDKYGSLPSKKGSLLNTINPGEVVRILHIEDEPKALYTQLIERGLYPGKEIKIISRNEKSITIAADGVERELELLLASKVAAEVLEDTKFENKKVKTLVDLKDYETGKVLNISPNCRGQQRRRLLDFGIVPGTEISVYIKNPLDDPAAYLVKDTIVALRKNQANKVIIE